MSDWLVTLLSVVGGGLITLLVALVFHWFAARQLRRVRGDIERARDDVNRMAESLETETKRLQKATEGIVMALEEPGEMEAVYEDGWFKGWQTTGTIYTESRPVDERGRLIRSPQFFMLKQRLRRGRRKIRGLFSSNRGG